MVTSLRNTMYLVATSLGLLACKQQTEPASQPVKVSIEVNENGYVPSSINVVAGKALVLAFTRTADKGCGHEIVFPERKITKPLPLHQEVVVQLTPKKDEKITFTCGMGMYHGQIIANPQ